MDLVRAELIIKGRVQGVFFRASTRQKAEELGLSGFVRNLPLMRVEVVLQGSKDTIEQAIAWCRQGPPGARVSDVRISWTTPHSDMAGFEIRH